MKSDVKRFKTEEENCQKAKAINKGMQRLPQPLTASHKKCKVINMDFIFDLPKSEEHTGMMTMLDKLSKRVHFVPLTDKSEKPDIAHIFYRKVHTLHGLSKV